ncbi:MAG: hypothetical protein VX727_01620 [Planctomycetota bacterium]|nr:hypothetical protein [Planctomycetota bacterium]
MHLNTLLGFATLVVVAAATRGELQSHSIAPSQSGWMTAPGNWGCCSVDSINLNPTTVSIENCSTMGGYCMGGKDIGAWIFELPDLPEGTTLVSARFTGGRYGAYGSGSMYYRWLGDESMSISSANDTIFSPDLTNYVYWPSSSTYNIVVGNQLFGPELQGRLMAVAIASNDTNMYMYNSGSQGTTLNLVVDVPESPCDGDMNNDRSVGIDDLLEVISGWNDPYGIDELLDVLDGWGSDC